MYCRNCGNEILETDKYCEKCGMSISKNQKNTKTFKTNIPTQLPMNWWNFWKYIRFPLGFILSCFNLQSYGEYSFDFYTSCFFIIEILIIILMCFAYYFFLEQKKIGYDLFNAYLFIETIWNCACSTSNTFLQSEQRTVDTFEFLLTFIVSLVIVGIIWILPNYIYFKKRKKYFCN